MYNLGVEIFTEITSIYELTAIFLLFIVWILVIHQSKAKELNVYQAKFSKVNLFHGFRMINALNF